MEVVASTLILEAGKLADGQVVMDTASQPRKGLKDNQVTARIQAWLRTKGVWKDSSVKATPYPLLHLYSWETNLQIRKPLERYSLENHKMENHWTKASTHPTEKAQGG